MPSLLQALSARWDVWTGRFDCFLAQSPEDVDGCVRVLEAVRREELNRVAGESVLDSHAFGSESLDYRLFACRDRKSGEIIGCMRLTRAIDTWKIPSSREEYRLDLFDEEFRERLTIFTRLAVLRSHRRTPAALVLMVHCFERCLADGDHAILQSCEPNLYPMYRRLGLRPIGPIHNSPSGGYRIPMICIADREHLAAVKSPALSLLGKEALDRGGPARSWYAAFERDHAEADLGISFLDERGTGAGPPNPLVEGLSEGGRERFLKNAVVLECREGDVLIAEEDGGKAFGLVSRGLVEIVVDGEVVAVCGPGDVFGEIAYVLDIRRTARVVAGDPETRVILFSVSAIGRLERESDRTAAWRNLASVLARKLVDTTDRLV